ncbi:MAG: hypothetical protein LBH28_02155 [Oscillospiraceae bacterium]|nr:hypothetical protein [Oscillospiraceae bacterium]
MITRWIVPMLLLAACALVPQYVSAAEAEAEKDAPKQSTRSKMIIGIPVNVNLMGAGGLPEGKLLTNINASFADRIRSQGEGAHRNMSDVFSQTWLLKLRYGITDYLEVWSTTPYINNHRSNPEPASVTGAPNTIYGVGDTFLGVLFTALHERRGDPVTASASAAALIPIASWGVDHPAGFGVWGFRGQAAISKFLTRDIKVETEGVWVTRFGGCGNQDVQIGDQFQWNAQARYLFDSFDIGLESTMVWQLTNYRYQHGRGANDMRSFSHEWFVGPSVNFAIDKLGMWAGFGAFFPVLQRFQNPGKVENLRAEFKIGKLW